MRNYKRIWRLLTAPIIITYEELPARIVPLPGLGLSINYCGATLRGTKMAFQLPDDKTATITVDKTKTLDTKGLPAEVSNLTYVSSDPAVATVDASGIVTPVGVGTVSINVTADEVAGDATSAVSDIIEVEVVAGKAVSFGATITLNP